MNAKKQYLVNRFKFRTATLTLILFLSFNLLGQNTKVISLEPFHNITLEGASSFVLIPSTQNKVEIIIETEDVMNYIKINVKNDQLFINTTGKNKDLSKICSKLIFKIYFKSIYSLAFEGAGKLTTEGTIKAQKLVAKLKGAGSMDLKINSYNFVGRMNGAGSLLVKGKCENSNLKLSGVGSIKAHQLNSKKTVAKVNGIGQIKVSVSKQLEAEVNGIGSIYYAGNPSKKIFSKNGLGSIKPLKE